MNRQNQWLFETPPAPESSYYNNPEYKTRLEREWETQSGHIYSFPLAEEEWETVSTANRNRIGNLHSRRIPRARNSIIIRTASLPPLKVQSQNESVLTESSGQPSIQLTGFPPTPPPPGTTLVSGFGLGSAQLTADHIKIIRKSVRDAIARMPKMVPLSTLVIDIEGHEDETGNPARFGNVGYKRAQAVAKVFAEELVKEMKKVNPANLRDVAIKISSAGPTRPIRSNVTPAGRALNRRVEIRMKEDASRVI
jgi:outer membrane protein OmpA-like peptidoglycan-associated protein